MKDENIVGDCLRLDQEECADDECVGMEDRTVCVRNVGRE